MNNPSRRWLLEARVSRQALLRGAMGMAVPGWLAASGAAGAYQTGTPAATPEPATGATASPAAAGFPRTFRHDESIASDEYARHLPAEVVITERPQRIVSLAPGEYTDGLLALGIVPVGSGTYVDVTGATDDPAAWPPAIAEEAVAAGIVSVGQGWQPDIELILTLQPDLIIGTTDDPAGDENLMRLAPLIQPRVGRDWRATFRQLAFALGEEERAEEVIAAWEARAHDIGERAGPVSVALIRPRPESVWIYGPPSNAGTILSEAGLDMLEAPEDSSVTADAPGAIGEVSIERIQEMAESDHLFVITYSVDDQELEAFVDHPLWQRLPAVQAGNVHFVEGTAWTNHGPLGAAMVLDEIEAALIGD